MLYFFFILFYSYFQVFVFKILGEKPNLNPSAFVMKCSKFQLLNTKM